MDNSHSPVKAVREEISRGMKIHNTKHSPDFTQEPKLNIVHFPAERGFDYFVDIDHRAVAIPQTIQRDERCGMCSYTQYLDFVGIRFECMLSYDTPFCRSDQRLFWVRYESHLLEDSCECRSGGIGTLNSIPVKLSVSMISKS